MDGNKKNKKIASVLNIPLMAMGEFANFELPVLTEKLSNIPAELAAIKSPKRKKMLAKT